MATTHHSDVDLREAAPTDGGEPQGTHDTDRPAMLGRTFRRTLGIGMLAGLVIAVAAHALLITVWYSANSWSWILVALGGLAVGGALTLPLYGDATDRTDTGRRSMAAPTCRSAASGAARSTAVARGVAPPTSR